MALKMIRKDNQFRVQGQEISLDWLADTRANRKATVVFLRLLSKNGGQPLFTHQQLAKVVNSSNRQAASNHLELFRACGSDFIAFLKHKRKVNDEVVSAVYGELSTDPLVLLADLLSLPLPDACPPPDLSSAQQKQRTNEALVAWILEEADRQAVVLRKTGQ